jgi:NAD(P)-dependent dehydrogenase (short-subunit alcohol dehydrogenase family)
MRDDLDLAGLRALVTGGTKGIGKAVVARLREAGAKVLASARSLRWRRTTCLSPPIWRQPRAALPSSMP